MMANPLPNPQPPNAVEPHQGNQFGALNGKAVQLAGWSKTLTLWLKNTAVGPLVQQSNTLLSEINTLNAQVAALIKQVDGLALPITTSEIADHAVTTPKLSVTGVTPGNYTNTNLTVGVDGRLTAASNGVRGGAFTVYVKP